MLFRWSWSTWRQKTTWVSRIGRLSGVTWCSRSWTFRISCLPCTCKSMVPTNTLCLLRWIKYSPRRTPEIQSFYFILLEPAVSAFNRITEKREQRVFPISKDFIPIFYRRSYTTISRVYNNTFFSSIFFFSGTERRRAFSTGNNEFRFFYISQDAFPTIESCCVHTSRDPLPINNNILPVRTVHVQKRATTRTTITGHCLRGNMNSGDLSRALASYMLIVRTAVSFILVSKYLVGRFRLMPPMNLHYRRTWCQHTSLKI